MPIEGSVGTASPGCNRAATENVVARCRVEARRAALDAASGQQREEAAASRAQLQQQLAAACARADTLQVPRGCCPGPLSAERSPFFCCKTGSVQLPRVQLLGIPAGGQVRLTG